MRLDAARVRDVETPRVQIDSWVVDEVGVDWKVMKWRHVLFRERGGQDRRPEGQRRCGIGHPQPGVEHPFATVRMQENSRARERSHFNSSRREYLRAWDGRCSMSCTTGPAANRICNPSDRARVGAIESRAMSPINCKDC